MVVGGGWGLGGGRKGGMGGGGGGSMGVFICQLDERICYLQVILF